MNSNIIAYIMYICITLYIIIWVGKMFHRNGRIFILSLFQGDKEPADNINNLLLLAYYLFNTGYAFLKLRTWERVRSPDTIISSLSHHLGLLILILALTHYFNMILIYFLSKKHNSLIH